MSHSFLSQLGWEPLRWVSFQVTESPQTFPQADNASSASLPWGVLWAALQGWKSIQQGMPHAPTTAGAAVSSRLPPKHHTTKEPHTLSFLLLLCFNLKLCIYSGQLCWKENDLSALLPVNLFLPLQESHPGFSLKNGVSAQWLPCAQWLDTSFLSGFPLDKQLWKAIHLIQKIWKSWRYRKH